MILLVGLGNPGSRYAFNRHNIGAMAVDAIAVRHDFPAWRSRFHGAAAEGLLGRRKCLLLKPMTYMNESGRSVAAAAQFYKLAPDAIIVFHDELDLQPGKLRVKTGGGVAGHNGLRSIAAHIGPEFRRVRLGIGHPGDKGLVHNYVLRDFAKAEREWLEPLLTAVAEHAPLLAAGHDANFMNKVHLALNPPEAKPEDADQEHSG
ncbi:MAG: aminoacyl-tRNA hydrolase [Hyphomicrobiales bacterium]|nr:aminoacyl-tRNA hydrolase [Hyphomicrobiales bacterium]